MKTNILKKLILTGILLSNFAQAQVLNPKSLEETISSLTSGVLSDSQVQDIFRPTAMSNFDHVVSDLKVYSQTQSLEGVPNGSEYFPGTGNVMDGAYSSAELIEEALQERLDYTLGERISFLMSQSQYIVQHSGNLTGETLLRYTLNRSVDFINHVLPVAGINTQEIARWTANFLKKSFELAAAFGNNNAVVVNVFEPSVSATSNIPFENFIAIHNAEFGKMYASFLWKESTALTTDTSKAIILMKILTYLGWDLNSDLRRREGPIAKGIRDIYKVQHGIHYQNVLKALRAGREPDSRSLAGLRVNVHTLLENFSERMNEF